MIVLSFTFNLYLYRSVIFTNVQGIFSNIFKVRVHVKAIWLICTHSKDFEIYFANTFLQNSKGFLLFTYTQDTNYINFSWLFCFCFLLDLIKDKTTWLNNPGNTYIGRHIQTFGFQSIRHNPFKMTNATIPERVRVVWKYLGSIKDNLRGYLILEGISYLILGYPWLDPTRWGSLEQITRTNRPNTGLLASSVARYLDSARSYEGENRTGVEARSFASNKSFDNVQIALSTSLF